MRIRDLGYVDFINGGNFFVIDDDDDFGFRMLRDFKFDEDLFLVVNFFLVFFVWDKFCKG